MNWKLFFSTFALVFLAELGDKTQLTAFAASAGQKSPWPAFFGASLALVLSTFIAVFAGSFITRFVPERYLKIGAAVLFLIFGSILLISNLKPQAEESVGETQLREGVLVSFVKERVSDLEGNGADFYQKLSACAQNEALSDLFLLLSKEETLHSEDFALLSGESGQLGEMSEVALKNPFCEVPEGEASDRSLLQKAILHEEEEIEFYAALSRVMPTAKLKGSFSAMAAKEKDHLKRLKDFA